MAGSMIDFNRQGLRKATKFVEGDYSGINPRRFYRTLKRSLEEIQEGNDFKYQTTGSQESDLEIKSEDVGQNTGVVKGRLLAESDWYIVGDGNLEYRPYGPHGALAIVIGLFFLLLGIGDAVWGIVGILLIVAGGYGYWQTESGEFAISRQDVIRVLMTGEVSERTVDTEQESRTDIFANMSVVYAGDAFVAVETTEIDELKWTLRRELVSQVKRWHNQIVDSEQEQLTVEGGFTWHLKAWANRDLESDRHEIDSVQSKLLTGPFEYRLNYTDRLEKQLSDEMQQQLAGHEEELMVELEELAEDLDIFVEREGLEHTNRVEQRQNTDTPQVEGRKDSL
ncbi:hypothetical protein C5B89_03770 [Haloferax sp. Atlit-47N]|uniref:Uncharacterized protein n=3 Tax=Haloferax TaxID=2251 RepID=D4GV58_HALVD|nr:MULTISPECIES: hypothetical protein [Haloferax]ADE04660.2 uncharacterized protein HVO_0951 [Haloferax volcanii DS2]MBS8119537.1 hypothetical protein [Haloferax volcanii]MBS8124549.1 hypothetical protein [Haloferax volcanii]MBS8128612.1 hypothetical protein [Haloferax volcanii]MBS8132477.1 hypothetical protein [Haloferax volcanii]